MHRLRMLLLSTGLAAVVFTIAAELRSADSDTAPPRKNADGKKKKVDKKKESTAVREPAHEWAPAQLLYEMRRRITG